MEPAPAPTGQKMQSKILPVSVVLFINLLFVKALNCERPDNMKYLNEARFCLTLSIRCSNLLFSHGNQLTNICNTTTVKLVTCRH